MNLNEIQYHETEVVVDETETAYEAADSYAGLPDSLVRILDPGASSLDLAADDIDLSPFMARAFPGAQVGGRLSDGPRYVWVDLDQLDQDQWTAAVPALVTQLYLRGGATDLETELVRSAGTSPSRQLIGRISSSLRPRTYAGEIGDVVFSEPVELALPVIAGGIVPSAGETTLTAAFSQETSTEKALGITFSGLRLTRSCTYKLTTGIEFTCGPEQGVVGELLVPFWKTVRRWRPQKGFGEWFTNVVYEHDGTGRAMVGTRARVVPPGELLGLAAGSRYMPLRGDAGHISKSRIEVDRDTVLQFGGGVYGGQLGVTATLQRSTSVDFAVDLRAGTDRRGLILQDPTGLVVQAAPSQG